MLARQLIAQTEATGNEFVSSAKGESRRKILTFVTNPIPIQILPQTRMIAGINLDGLKYFRRRPEAASKMTYPMKNVSSAMEYSPLFMLRSRSKLFTKN